MNTTVISETELEAQDQDKDDVLFYTLQEVTLVSAPSSLLWAPLPCASSRAESPTSPGCQQLPAHLMHISQLPWLASPFSIIRATSSTY